jgi:hypothetical protein
VGPPFSTTTQWAGTMNGMKCMPLSPTTSDQKRMNKRTMQGSSAVSETPTIIAYVAYRKQWIALHIAGESLLAAHLAKLGDVPAHMRHRRPQSRRFDRQSLGSPKLVPGRARRVKQGSKEIMSIIRK